MWYKCSYLWSLSNTYTTGEGPANGSAAVTVRRTTETELLLFLTPRVIRTDAGADSLSAPLLERAKREQS